MATQARVVDYICTVGAPAEVRAAVSAEKKVDARKPYTPVILQRYPETNYSKREKFNDQAKMFCFPNEIRILESCPAFEQEPFPFVLTEEDGGRLYCCAIITWSGRAGCYFPTAICVISRWQFFQQMSTFLTYLIKQTKLGLQIPIERVFCNFIFETPLPPQGRLNVVFSGLHAAQIAANAENLNIVFTRPPPNRLPLFSLSLETLFRRLSPETIVLLFSALLTEQRILLCASTVHELAVIIEILCSFLFPFFWRHIYIPVMPAKMTAFCCAPMPFLVGVSTNYMPDISMLTGVVVVNLDENQIQCTDENALPGLNDRRYNFLMKTLIKVTGGDKDALLGNRTISPALELEVREAFLKNMCWLMKDYKSFLNTPSKETDVVVEKFDKVGFSNKHPDNGPVLKAFMETQMFQCFIDDRYDPSHRTFKNNHMEVLYFDESIDVVCMNKKSAFLNDLSQQHSEEKFVAPTPSLDGISDGFRTAKGWPAELNFTLAGSPRPVRALTDEQFQSNTSKVDVSALSMKFFTDMRLYSLHFRSLKDKTARQESSFNEIVGYFKASQGMDEKYVAAYEQVVKDCVEKSDSKNKTDTTMDGAWQALKDYASNECKGQKLSFDGMRRDICIPLYSQTGDASIQLKLLFDQAKLLEKKTQEVKLGADLAKSRYNAAQTKYTDLKTALGETTALTEVDSQKLIRLQKELEDSHLSLDGLETQFQNTMRQYETTMPVIIEKIRRINLDRIETFQSKMMTWTSLKRTQLLSELESLDKLDVSVRAINKEEDRKSFTEGNKDFWSTEAEKKEEHTGPDDWDLRNSALLQLNVLGEPRKLYYELDMFGNAGFIKTTNECHLAKTVLVQLISQFTTHASIHDATSKKTLSVASTSPIPDNVLGTERTLWESLITRFTSNNQAQSSYSNKLTYLGNQLVLLRGELKYSVRRFQDHRQTLEQESKELDRVLQELAQIKDMKESARRTAEEIHKNSLARLNQPELEKITLELQRLLEDSRQADQNHNLAKGDSEACIHKSNVCLSRMLCQLQTKQTDFIRCIKEVLSNCCVSTKTFLITTVRNSNDNMLSLLRVVDSRAGFIFVENFSFVVKLSCAQMQQIKYCFNCVRPWALDRLNLRSKSDRTSLACSGN
jgi:hypothetical protein